MRRSAILALGIGLLLASPAAAQEARIVGSLADGTPSPRAPPKDLPEFTVEKTDEHRLAERRVIMHRVADPGLPDPPPPPPPASREEIEAMRNSPEVQALIANYKPPHTIFLSATVVDRKATFLRWWHEGEEFQAWSNVDFDHLGGFAEFETRDRSYMLLMGLGNIDRDTARRGNWLEEPPNLGVGYPAYALTQGDESNAEAMAMKDALHDLYATDKARLIAAYEARERARAEREAWLKANPPQPKDTVIHFWPRAGSRYLNGNAGQREESR